MPEKTSPPQAQSSSDGTTIPPATSIRVLGSGLFTLADGKVLLNGSIDDAGDKSAATLSWKGGQLKAQDDNGDWSVWTADVKAQGPMGSWAPTSAP